MLQYSEFLLADLVEETEVSVRAETDKLADLVTDVLDSVVICDTDGYRLVLKEGLDAYFDLLCTVLLFLQLFVNLIIVEEIPSQLELSPTENGKRLFLFLFRQVTSLQSANGHTLTQAHPFLIRIPCQLVKSFREAKLL